MNNTIDLNIEEEILPLFDHTLNNYAKANLLEILNMPLSSLEEVQMRQSIIKGFKDNTEILSNYSYQVSYLKDVYQFLESSEIQEFAKKKIKYKFFTSRKEKAQYSSKIVQMLLLFHKLQNSYFTRLKLSSFPKEYAKEIKKILEFLSQFNLNQNEVLIREYKFSDAHVVEISKKINSLKQQKKVLEFWTKFFLFEAYNSIHQGMVDHGFNFPEFSKRKLALYEFYHPLLKDPVKNDFETSKTVILLNGPNMSGKSTFLKAISLCVYLGHLGLGIPAAKGKLPFFTGFSVSFNKRDEILNGYSHFMTEVVNLKNVLMEALKQKKCFVVFDELFSGTNVEDAFEICKTTINGLTKFEHSIFFISTHIQKLKVIKNEEVATYHIDCELVDNKPHFNFKIKKGWSDVKVGRILFAKEGLNKLLS